MVPRGIHVRINLTTGKKEGKILEESDTNNTSGIKTSDQNSALTLSETDNDDAVQDTLSPEASMRERKRRLEQALKNIPDESLPYSEEELKEVVKKYKSYETIKQDLKNLDLNVKTDFELLADLFSKFDSLNKEASDEEINSLFEDLDYLVHQIDNANEFVRAGGLDKIVLPNIQNQTNSVLKLQSIKLLGTLTQNNPTAQIAAFEKNTGFLLLQILSQSSDTKEISAGLFALGSLIRGFPVAQNELLSKPGLRILVGLLGRQVDYKNKLKVLVLLTDLLRESQEMKDYSAEFESEKKRQYKEIDLMDRLKNTDYCWAIDEVMNEYRHDYLTDQYVLQDMLNVLNESKTTCQVFWSDSPVLRHTLLVIKNKYDSLVEKVKDEDLTEIVKDLDNINDFLYSDANNTNYASNLI